MHIRLIFINYYMDHDILWIKDFHIFPLLRKKKKSNFLTMAFNILCKLASGCLGSFAVSLVSIYTVYALNMWVLSTPKYVHMPLFFHILNLLRKATSKPLHASESGE